MDDSSTTSTNRDQATKPQWQTPTLVCGDIAAVTAIDSVSNGNDGVISYGGTVLGQTS